MEPQEIGEICIAMLGERNHESINELRRYHNYNWCASGLDFNDTVTVYGGVMATYGTLVHVGQYIAFCDSENEEV